MGPINLAAPEEHAELVEKNTFLTTQRDDLVKAKDEICVVESVKAASDIYAPIDGEIIEVNNNLENDAAIINQDAENEGWIFKMKISDSNQYSELMSEDEYKQFLEQ